MLAYTTPRCPTLTPGGSPMPLRTTLTKATRQIERRDPQGAEQYRAELRYFHYKPRVVLGVADAP